MKRNPYSKHPRNRPRRPPGAKGGYSPNRVFESNGPDVKLRGTATQLHEKYLALARDAQSSGDRVAAEGYFQYAEHYQRVLSAVHEQNGNAAAPPRSEPGDKEAGDGTHGAQRADSGNGQDEMLRARRARAAHAGQTASPPLDDDGMGDSGGQRNGRARKSQEG